MTPRIIKRGNQLELSDQYTVTCISVQTIQLSAQKSLTEVKIKIELDLNADTCVVGDQCLVMHDHNRPVNVYGYDPKAGLKQACIVDSVFAYDQSKMCQVAIFLINQVIEMKGLSHHLLMPHEQCSD